MSPRRAAVIAALDTSAEEGRRLATWLQRRRPRRRHGSEHTGADRDGVEAPAAARAERPPYGLAISGRAGR